MSTEISATAKIVDSIITGRRSIRAFLPRDVDSQLLDHVLQVAARAPSGNNTQPWLVHVVRGAALKTLCDKVCAAFDAGQDEKPEYDYYPPQFFEPYLSRRRKVGWDLYALLGIGRGDKEKMRAQVRRNFTFFNAPVGLIFTFDRRLSPGSWLDYGMFLQNVMLAAQAHGLSTCSQAAWIDYYRAIGEALALPEHEMVMCGIALGYADPSAVENTLVSERAALSEFVFRHE